MRSGPCFCAPGVVSLGCWVLEEANLSFSPRFPSLLTCICYPCCCAAPLLVRCALACALRPCWSAAGFYSYFYKIQNNRAQEQQGKLQFIPRCRAKAKDEVRLSLCAAAKGKSCKCNRGENSFQIQKRAKIKN